MQPAPYFFNTTALSILGTVSFLIRRYENSEVPVRLSSCDFVDR